jgi:hypothetical protein
VGQHGTHTELGDCDEHASDEQISGDGSRAVRPAGRFCLEDERKPRSDFVQETTHREIRGP